MAAVLVAAGRRTFRWTEKKKHPRGMYCGIGLCHECMMVINQALLETYPERAFLTQSEQGQVNGYLFAQAKRIGPWIMNENSDAEGLLLSALSLPFNGTVSMVTPAENAEAVSLLRRLEFKIARVNRHMTYGSNASMGQREKVLWTDQPVLWLSVPQQFIRFHKESD